MIADSNASSPRAPLPFLGLACAVGVSTIYYNQPLLLEMSRTYGATVARTGFVAVATQVGYALGMLAFVPLGDVVERRALMMRMYAAVAIGLLLTAMAPGLNLLIVGSFVIGALASVTHIVLPIAPDLVSHEQRGRAIGIVMTGLLLGILLARTFAGWVSHIHGWRYVFVVAAVMNASFVPLLWRVMPKLPPKQKLRYRDAMVSLWTLFRTQPLLRESSVIGGLAFASFSCFWTTLVFLLGTRYGLGAGVAGTFGVVGAAGAFVAPIAGRLADRRGSRWVVAIGLALLAVSFLMLWGRGEPAALAWLASDGIGAGRDRAGRGRADDADRQPDAHLRAGAVGAQPSEHGLYGDLLQRRGHRLGVVDDRLGALALERSMYPGALLHWSGGDRAQLRDAWTGSRRTPACGAGRYVAGSVKQLDSVRW